MGRSEEAEDWVKAVIIILIGLFIVAVIITEFCKVNQLFCSIVFGGGILVAIIVGAKKLL